jgi:hypothetical protein
MTSRRRDLGTRGRVLVAAAAVGSVGVLSGWMAATDHTAATPADASSSSSGAAAGTNDSGPSASSQPSFDDGSSAVPGATQAPTALPHASTGAS